MKRQSLNESIGHDGNRRWSWRRWTDWVKHQPMTLRAADWMGRGRGRMRWLDQLNPPGPAPWTPDLRGWENHSLAAAWIGHATVLLRIGGKKGMTILTDPVLGNRVGVGLGLITGGPRRLVAPALSVRQLPRLDLILISHAHFDHLDRPTLVQLPKNVPVVTSLRTRDLIEDLGFRDVTELGWGESFESGGVKVTAQAVRHWGARTFFDVYRGYSAFLIESGGQRVLYGGDTAYHDGFGAIGPVDLAILGIGAYNPYIQAHATPEQVMLMADQVGARRVLPMHHSTFRLSHEPMEEPLERVLAAAGDAERIIIRQIGQQWSRGQSVKTN